MWELFELLRLAAAAQLDMGQAAEVVTNIMAGYGIEAKDLSSANDVLVDTFTNANVTLGDRSTGRTSDC